MRVSSPPEHEEQLVQRAEGLAGRTLAEAAEFVGSPVPPDLTRHKGWMGQVIEAVLGADAGSRPVPDFEALGIELKTLPIDAKGRVREGTFVSSAPLDGSMATRWEQSRVCHKLARVLWVPLVGIGAPGDRVIGSSFLWSPNEAQEHTLRTDWEELSGLLSLGEHWQIDARRGTALQLRPKAAHSEALTWTLDGEGEWIRTGPVGFYLRARFTSELLHRFR